MKASARRVDERRQYGLIDLDYALAEYDEFEQCYTEGTEKIAEIKENTEAIASYSDAEVEALWAVKKHQEAIDPDGDYMSDKVLYIMKAAQSDADKFPYLTGGDKTKPQQYVFHGDRNYIANYIYLMRIARICYNGDYETALKKAKYPYSNNKSQAGMLKSLRAIDFKEALVKRGIESNDKNKARYIVGLSIHLVMDVYSHKAYFQKNGKWNKIENPNDKHSISYIPSRYTSAKNAALDIINVWHNVFSPDSYEFMQDSHSKNAFHLYRFWDFANTADPANVSVDTKNGGSKSNASYNKWFKERSVLDTN